jgi:transcriptional regulator with XRE-family HTH domain
MLKQKELIQTPEYWMEAIQNELYRQLKKFLEENEMTQTQLAEKLHFTKGYISQIMNGNFNYTLRKLIELSLALGIVPDLEFRSFAEYLDKEQKNYYDAAFLLRGDQGMIIVADKTKKGDREIETGKLVTLNLPNIPPSSFVTKTA